MDKSGQSSRTGSTPINNSALITCYVISGQSVCFSQSLLVEAKLVFLFFNMTEQNVEVTTESLFVDARSGMLPLCLHLCPQTCDTVYIIRCDVDKMFF